MKSFSEWKKSEVKIKKVPDSTDLLAPKLHTNLTGGWKASKPEIIDHWRKLPPGKPMSQMRSVPANHKGPTYSFDGLRVTGSSEWIDFVLSRLKEVLNYETEKGGQTRLQVIYKQIVDNKTEMPVPESFVLYVQVKQRENAGPHISKIKKLDRIPVKKVF